MMPVKSAACSRQIWRTSPASAGEFSADGCFCKFFGSKPLCRHAGPRVGLLGGKMDDALVVYVGIQKSFRVGRTSPVPALGGFPPRGQMRARSFGPSHKQHELGRKRK